MKIIKNNNMGLYKTVYVHINMYIIFVLLVTHKMKSTMKTPTTLIIQDIETSKLENMSKWCLSGLIEIH